MLEVFKGPVIAVEVQPDPLAKSRFAVYLRHDDAPGFKPAEFHNSYRSLRTALREASALALKHKAQVMWKEGC